MKTLFNPCDCTAPGRWMRGQLHTHTTRSDGQRDPQTVINEYAARGHDFLMLSDHDILADEAFYATLDAKGMILIPGNEISARGPHLLHVHADRRLEPYAQRQLIMNELAKTGGRGFIIVNHPNWQDKFDHCKISQMREWTGYAGMEIYNGVISRLDGSPYATNKWDMLLADGRRIWGFANDDSHKAVGDSFLGWNVAWVRQSTVAGVVEALQTGRFYCSTGVEITSIETEGLNIRLKTKNARRITALQQTGKRFAQADANSIEVTVPDNATYVRFECWGDGEQFAWSQPVFVEEAK